MARNPLCTLIQVSQPYKVGYYTCPYFMEEETETGRVSNLSKITQLRSEKARQSGPIGCALSHYIFYKNCAGCSHSTPRGRGRCLSKAGELLSGKTIVTPTGFWFLNMVLCIALHRLVQLSQEDIMRNSAHPVLVFSLHFHQGTTKYAGVTISAHLFLFIHGKWEHEALSVLFCFFGPLNLVLIFLTEAGVKPLKARQRHSSQCCYALVLSNSNHKHTPEKTREAGFC